KKLRVKSVHNDRDFPGCPYCGRKHEWVVCSCGTLADYDSNSGYFTCPKCGNSGPVEKSIVDIKGGGL
ncbi:MAG: hypothetical protein HUJ56_04845, partial [Erysipelotrichaceae bacterium]|nr:hypothetical protein [Erysipelotrichaceae bacterium]